MSQPIYLFSGGKLHDWLMAKQQRAAAAIQTWDPDKLLMSSDEAIAEELLEQFSVICPQLERQPDKITHPDPHVEKRDLGAGYARGDVRRSITVRKFIVPFDGEPEVFRLAPGRSNGNPPWAELDSIARTLTLSRDDSPGSVPDVPQIQRDVLMQLDAIDVWLEWSREAIRAHNAIVGDLVPISRRRESIQRERGVQEALGFRMNRRDDASAYSVPLIRRRFGLASQADPGGTFHPEPALLENDYEAAMGVLVSSRNALERSPSLTSSYGEEQIRDLLLIFLNAQFEGAAAGEVFNKSGKTDILIRVDDRNIFIGECKIWGGPNSISQGLEQLFDRYLTWRDAKAALMLFVRDGDLTAITRKSIEVIEAHPQYLRTVSNGGPGERSDFVFHSKGDRSREVRLAFLSFFLPKS